MYSRVLPTDTPSPIFSERRGRLYTGYLERIIPSSKVRRIVHSKLKLFHLQSKTYCLSDENHPADNLSHTNKSLSSVKTDISVIMNVAPRPGVGRSRV